MKSFAQTYQCVQREDHSHCVARCQFKIAQRVEHGIQPVDRHHGQHRAGHRHREVVHQVPDLHET